jgi:uncharacterized repeat protein (TIGR04138 family)
VKDPLRALALSDGRFQPEAFQFLYESLECAVRLHGRAESEVEGGRHVSGQELLLGLKHHGQELFGPLGAQVWRTWGIRSTLDWGRMVFLLVDAGLLHRQDDDKVDDFKDGFELDEAFVVGYEPVLPDDLEAAPEADSPPPCQAGGEASGEAVGQLGGSQLSAWPTGISGDDPACGPPVHQFPTLFAGDDGGQEGDDDDSLAEDSDESCEGRAPGDEDETSADGEED